MKLLTFLYLLWFSLEIRASELSSECGELETFIPYKAGIQAEKKMLTADALIIFCHLALQGDYRAQFKLAQYYYHGIPEFIEPDYEFAYIWSRLSNKYAVTKKKKLFSEKIYEQIKDHRKDHLNLKLDKAFKIIPTGARIDTQNEPIDYAKLIQLNNKRKGKKQFTGSRVRRDKPILSTRIFDYD